MRDSLGTLIPTVQTDEFGNYTLSIAASISTINPTSYIIECIGGIDIATNIPLNYPITAIYTPLITNYSSTNLSNVCLTPLTTIVTNIVKTSINANSSAATIAVAVSNATTQVAIAFGISGESVNIDYIATSNTLVTAAAVKIATITNIISISESKSATSVLDNISTIIQNASAKIIIDNTFITSVVGQPPIQNLTSLIMDVVNTIDALDSTIDSIYKVSIGGTNVASLPLTSYTTQALTSATSTTIVGILSNICFKAGTKIVTDQGIVNIEKITEQNSIRGKRVLLVSNTINIEDYMVVIKKGSLYENVPNIDTYVTKEHKIFYNRKMIKVKHLVNEKTIIRKKMRKDVVYNVLLEGDTSGRMIANGLIAETLDPSSPMVKLLNTLKYMSDSDKEEIIMELNKKMNLEHEKRRNI